MSIGNTTKLLLVKWIESNVRENTVSEIITEKTILYEKIYLEIELINIKVKVVG